MINIKKLDSGISLVSEFMPNMKSVSIGIWVKAGAVDEEPYNYGISHFIEHMMFKGTTNRTAKALAEDVDKIGGQINAFTGKEATCYYIKSLEENLEKSMEILFDMFHNSLFDPEELEREKQVIYEEMKMIQDTPDELAHDIICEEVFEGRPLGNSIIGTPESLEGIKRDEIVNFIQRKYTKGKVVVAIAGKFEQEKVEDLVNSHFANLKEEISTESKNHTKYIPKTVVKVKQIEQSHICLGIPTIPWCHKDYHAFAILNNIMGGTMSSRFFQNIREKKGLAYSVYSINSSFVEDGYYTIYAGVAHDKIEETIFAIGEELSELFNNGISQEELSKAKEQLKSSYIFGLESVNGRMFAIGKRAVLLGKVQTPEDIIDAIDNVKLEDVNRIGKYIANLSEYSAVAVTDSKIDLREIMKEAQ